MDNQLTNIINQIKVFLYGVFLYLKIDKEIALIVVYLILADMFFGTLKTIFLKEIRFEFSEFYKGLIKKSLLLIIVMVLALISKGLGFKDFALLPTIVMKAMVLSEGISVINNARSIFDGKEHKSSDLISSIMAKIEMYLKRYFEKILDFFDDKKKE